MSDVPYIELKDLCDVNQGLQIPISKRFKSKGKNRYFYITVQFLKNSYIEKYFIENPPKSCICNEEDIIVVRTGSTGQVLTGIKGCFHNNFFKVNYNKEKVLGKYLYYCLTSNEKQKEMKNRAGVTTIPDLNHFMFLDMKIPLNQYHAQKKIVEILDNLNEKIELNNKINAELEEMAKLIYDYWFVQFDFPDENGKPYKFSGGRMVYDETLKREIPVGWDVADIGSTFKTALGGTPSTAEAEYWDCATIPWLSSGEIVNFPITSSEECIAQKGVDNSAAELLPKGSVVISIVRHIRVSILAIDSATNQSVVGIHETEKLKSSFVYPYLSREIPRLMSVRTGAQQPHINKREVDVSAIVIPQQDVLKKYYQAVDPVYKKIMLTAFESQKLAQLRDWLLPMLMNGQIKVI